MLLPLLWLMTSEDEACRAGVGADAGEAVFAAWESGAG